MTQTQTEDNRFWGKVARGDGDECWPWTASRNRDGYGNFRLGKTMVLAHRHAYSICKGPIGDGLHVCHACDRPECCNPAHLFLGSRSDNMRDAIRKGRKGKLSPEMADVIRQVYASGKYTQKEIGEVLGVTKEAISHIATGRSYGYS